MCRCSPTTRNNLDRLVKFTTILATFVLFTLGVSHVVYLFEAFEAKDGIESLLQSGSQLYTHERFLWYLLYSFGEAERIQDLRERSEDTIVSGPAQSLPPQSEGASMTSHTNLIPDYRNHLRVWKLTGLICLYSIAVGVNLGLILGLCRRISAFFIPWLVVNLVFVLVFFSLSLGTVIVHLAYHHRSSDSSPPIHSGVAPASDEADVVSPYSGLWCALVPFALFLLLGAYWILVIHLYLNAVRSERRTRRIQREQMSGMTESPSTYPMANGAKTNGFGRSHLMADPSLDEPDAKSMGVSEKQDASTSPMKTSPIGTKRGLFGLFQCCGSGKEGQHSIESKLAIRKPINLEDGVYYHECVQSMILPEDSSDEETADFKEDHSPFLPEMIKKEERRKIQKRKKEKEKEERRLLRSKERNATSSKPKPSSPPLEEEAFIDNAIYQPLQLSEDVNLWTEFDSSQPSRRSFKSATLSPKKSALKEIKKSKTISNVGTSTEGQVLDDPSRSTPQIAVPTHSLWSIRPSHPSRNVDHVSKTLPRDLSFSGYSKKRVVTTRTKTTTTTTNESTTTEEDVTTAAATPDIKHKFSRTRSVHFHDNLETGSAPSHGSQRAPRVSGSSEEVTRARGAHPPGKGSRRTVSLERQRENFF